MMVMAFLAMDRASRVPRIIIASPVWRALADGHPANQETSDEARFLPTRQVFAYHGLATESLGDRIGPTLSS